MKEWKWKAFLHIRPVKLFPKLHHLVEERCHIDGRGRVFSLPNHSDHLCKWEGGWGGLMSQRRRQGVALPPTSSSSTAFCILPLHVSLAAEIQLSTRGLYHLWLRNRSLSFDSLHGFSKGRGVRWLLHAQSLLVTWAPPPPHHTLVTWAAPHITH